MAEEVELHVGGDDEAPGWDAIDAALKPIYGNQKPYHVGTVLPFIFGGRDPITGISAYKNLKPTPHWHFITYGFTELWAKESSDPDISGFGFELTFRLACKLNEKKPPNWAFNLLQNFGRYVFETGNAFAANHNFPLNGPIKEGSKTQIEAAAFRLDPQFRPRKTPNGRIEFLQVVGLTMDELNAMFSWDTAKFLKLLAKDDPLLVTDLSRKSRMSDPTFAAKVEKLWKREGSSCEVVFCKVSLDRRKNPPLIRMQSIGVERLLRQLLGRIPFGNDFTLQGPDLAVRFRPGPRSQARLSKNRFTITLKQEHLRELTESLKPKGGLYKIPGVETAVIKVERTKITDPEGKVVKVVG